MSYLNSVTIIGIVGADPEQRKARNNNGSKFTVLSVATQRSPLLAVEFRLVGEIPTSGLLTTRPRRVGRERQFYEQRISLLCPDRSRWRKAGAVFCAPRAGFVSYSRSYARFGLPLWCGGRQPENAR
jgi:hypothetical protein